MFPVTVHVSAQKVSDQFCAAFEGGSNYWLTGASLKSARPADVEPGQAWYGFASPFETMGLRVKLTWIEDETTGKTTSKEIGRMAILKGLRLMAEKSPDHFADVVNESGDACTGDVLLQYILFGEIVFG